jgi:hypothetical protein
MSEPGGRQSSVEDWISGWYKLICYIARNLDPLLALTPFLMLVIFRLRIWEGFIPNVAFQSFWLLELFDSDARLCVEDQTLLIRVWGPWRKSKTVYHLTGAVQKLFPGPGATVVSWNCQEGGQGLAAVSPPASQSSGHVPLASGRGTLPGNISLLISLSDPHSFLIGHSANKDCCSFF